MNETTEEAARLHSKVPPDWYYKSMRRNPAQWLWHKIRFRQVGRLITPVKGKVLDIGSADGMFTKIISDKTMAKEVVGIDVLENSVKWANKHWEAQKNMSFELGNAHNLHLRGGTFDAVFALEVMEHVSRPDMALSEIRRVLKKGGYCVILVPTDNLLFRATWFLVSRLMWARIWEGCHVQSFNSKNRLSVCVRRAGFKIEKNKTFWFGMLNVVKARK